MGSKTWFEIMITQLTKAVRQELVTKPVSNTSLIDLRVDFFCAQGVREAVYAAMATMSLSVSFSTTGFISGLHAPCRVPF